MELLYRITICILQQYNLQLNKKNYKLQITIYKLQKYNL